MPIKQQNQTMDLLRLFLDRKDRKRVENYARERLKIFHERIIDDEGEWDVNEHILQVQKNMQLIDQTLKFPKPKVDPVEKTMSVVNNLREVPSENRIVYFVNV